MMDDGCPAPADEREHREWPIWGKILAYILMIGLASASIWVVDKEAVRATYYWDRQQPLQQPVSKGN